MLRQLVHSERVPQSWFTAACARLCTSTTQLSPDHYQTLGIPQHATTEEVKKAFRQVTLRLASQCDTVVFAAAQRQCLQTVFMCFAAS